MIVTHRNWRITVARWRRNQMRSRHQLSYWIWSEFKVISPSRRTTRKHTRYKLVRQSSKRKSVYSTTILVTSRSWLPKQNSCTNRQMRWPLTRSASNYAWTNDWRRERSSTIASSSATRMWKRRSRISRTSSVARRSVPTMWGLKAHHRVWWAAHLRWVLRGWNNHRWEGVCRSLCVNEWIISGSREVYWELPF